MKLHFVEQFSEGNTTKQKEALEKVFTLTNPTECDVIFCASIAKMSQAQTIHTQTNKPLVVYCWDYYIWAHEGRHHSYNWGKYADFLREADLIFVPSTSQQLRLKELLNLNSIVIHTGITTHDTPISDERFILDPVRYYPEENRTWAEDAAKELNIPIVHSEHQYSEADFRKLLATCSFLTCAYREASTGGLSLMEGLYLGKPSLVSNSPYMGAKDYLGKYGTYFQYDDFNDLKAKMKEMWEKPQTFSIEETREYMEQFSYDEMARKMKEAVCGLKKS